MCENIFYDNYDPNSLRILYAIDSHDRTLNQEDRLNWVVSISEILNMKGVFIDRDFNAGKTWDCPRFHKTDENPFLSAMENQLFDKWYGIIPVVSVYNLLYPQYDASKNTQSLNIVELFDAQAKKGYIGVDDIPPGMRNTLVEADKIKRNGMNFAKQSQLLMKIYNKSITTPENPFYKPPIPDEHKNKTEFVGMINDMTLLSKKNFSSIYYMKSPFMIKNTRHTKNDYTALQFSPSIKFAKGVVDIDSIICLPLHVVEYSKLFFRKTDMLTRSLLNIKQIHVSYRHFVKEGSLTRWAFNFVKGVYAEPLFDSVKSIHYFNIADNSSYTGMVNYLLSKGISERFCAMVLQQSKWTTLSPSLYGILQLFDIFYIRSLLYNSLLYREINNYRALLVAKYQIKTELSYIQRNTETMRARDDFKKIEFDQQNLFSQLELNVQTLGTDYHSFMKQKTNPRYEMLNKIRLVKLWFITSENYESYTNRFEPLPEMDKEENVNPLYLTISRMTNSLISILSSRKEIRKYFDNNILRLKNDKVYLKGDNDDLHTFPKGFWSLRELPKDYDQAVEYIGEKFVQSGESEEDAFFISKFPEDEENKFSFPLSKVVFVNQDPNAEEMELIVDDQEKCDNPEKRFSVLNIPQNTPGFRPQINYRIISNKRLNLDNIANIVHLAQRIKPSYITLNREKLLRNPEDFNFTGGDHNLKESVCVNRLAESLKIRRADIGQSQFLPVLLRNYVCEIVRSKNSISNAQIFVDKIGSSFPEKVCIPKMDIAFKDNVSMQEFYKLYHTKEDTIHRFGNNNNIPDMQRYKLLNDEFVITKSKELFQDDHFNDNKLCQKSLPFIFKSRSQIMLDYRTAKVTEKRKKIMERLENKKGNRGYDENLFKVFEIITLKK